MGIVTRALIFGGSGVVLGSLIVMGVGHWWPLIPSSGLAAFGVSLTLWRLLCGTAGTVARYRGVLAGALTGLLAHPVAWYLFLVWLYLRGQPSSLGDKPANPIESITGCLVLTFWSLLITGWLTVPAGAAVGFLLARRQARRPAPA